MELRVLLLSGWLVQAPLSKDQLFTNIGTLNHDNDIAYANPLVPNEEIVFLLLKMCKCRCNRWLKPRRYQEKSNLICKNLGVYYVFEIDSVTK